jgi:preprotein translocase subunit SecG
MNITLIQSIEIVIAVLLITVVLMQVRGSGTTLFGQAESTFRSRRGVERVLFRTTIGLTVVFVVLAAISVSSLVAK